MHTKTLWRWGAGALFAGAAIVASARNAAATHSLMVAFDNTSTGCFEDPSGNIFFGEAWGEDFLGDKYCEAITSGGTAMTACSTAATQHVAVLDSRDVTLARSGVSYGTSAPQMTWTNTSDQVNYAYSGSNCSTSLFVQSVGVETTSTFGQP